jgi:hypothetical protein
MANSFVHFNHTRQSYDRASEKLNLTGIDQDSEARADDDISKTLRKHGIPVARQELALPRARAMSIGRVPKSN